MHRHRDLERVPSAAGVVWSSLASAYVVSLIHLAIALIILTGEPGSTGLLGAAAVAAVSALCLFAAGGVAGYVRNSLLVATWGYVPGLAWVLAAGLWLAEAQARNDSVGSLGMLALVLVDPLVWVCLGLACGVWLTAARAGHLAPRPWHSAEHDWRGAAPKHVRTPRGVRVPEPPRRIDAAEEQEALERLLPASRGSDVGRLA